MSDFGFDATLPISQYYIERFLRQNETVLQGNILNCDKKEYTEIVNSLATGHNLSEAQYDCFILNQALPAAKDIKNVLKNCLHVLKPGGYFLFSTGGIYPRSVLHHETWGAYWSLTATVLNELLKEFVPGKNIKITPYGNIYTAACYLFKSPITFCQDHLDDIDKDYLFLLTTAVQKPG